MVPAVQAGEILDRLRSRGMSVRAIGARLDVGRTTIGRILEARGRGRDAHLLISIHTERKIAGEQLPPVLS
ncbi:hypothetical protein LK09_07735 [Microbacterium mangrovi]|uniref:Uncharacterized protein n=2 Tax=Microbacterium mangrovi TaxID=1348253 RepID=A0A0B2A6U2_9MICO|nr:hypothetical protein LK09_07735 [Microbacterium mangrovi]